MRLIIFVLGVVCYLFCAYPGLLRNLLFDLWICFEVRKGFGLAGGLHAKLPSGFSVRGVFYTRHTKAHKHTE